MRQAFGRKAVWAAVVAVAMIAPAQAPSASPSDRSEPAARSPTAALLRFSTADRRIRTVVGEKRAGGEIVATGSAGVLMFGPYITLPAGLYVIRIYGRCATTTCTGARFDVAWGGRPAALLGEEAVDDGARAGEATNVRLFTGLVEVPPGTADLEVRAFVERGTNLTVAGFDIVPCAIDSRCPPSRGDPGAWVFRARDGRVASLVGRKSSSGALETTGAAGYLMYGPYVPFSAGRYVVTVWGRCAGKDCDGLTFDVAADGGARVLAAGGATPTEAPGQGERILFETTFELADAVRDLEVRAQAAPATRAEISSYAIRPAGALPRGPTRPSS